MTLDAKWWKSLEILKTSGLKWDMISRTAGNDEEKSTSNNCWMHGSSLLAQTKKPSKELCAKTRWQGSMGRSATIWSQRCQAGGRCRCPLGQMELKGILIWLISPEWRKSVRICWSYIFFTLYSSLHHNIHLAMRSCSRETNGKRNDSNSLLYWWPR